MSQNKQVNQFDISGKVIFVGPPEQYVTKSHQTRSYRILILEVFVGNYADEVPFEFKEQNMAQLNQIIEGKWVTVTFCLRGQKTIKDGRARWYSRNEGLSVIKG